MDLMGEDGGRLASAFGAGWVAATTFTTAIGLWLRNFLTRGHAAEVDMLKAQIEGIKDELRDERKRCDTMEARLVQRINQLEGILIIHGNQKVSTVLRERAPDAGPPFNGE